MSFAVNKDGHTFAWGENKHNALMVGEKSQNMYVPTKVQYPSYFEVERLNKKHVNVVVNNQEGVTMYEAKRPVKSVASYTQQELDKVKTENFKLQNKVKELEKKLQKAGSSEQDEDDEHQIQRNYSNDKVIQNLN